MPATILGQGDVSRLEITPKGELSPLGECQQRGDQWCWFSSRHHSQASPQTAPHYELNFLKLCSRVPVLTPENYYCKISTAAPAREVVFFKVVDKIKIQDPFLPAAQNIALHLTLSYNLQVALMQFAPTLAAYSSRQVSAVQSNVPSCQCWVPRAPCRTETSPVVPTS